MWPALTKEELIFEHEHDEECTLCGRSFRNNETIAIGYDANNSMHMVCEDCLSKITPKVKYLHRCRAYKKPSPDDMLWRFMDLAKFISLLKERALYLTRIDQFSDPFECAIGLAEHKAKYDAFYMDFLKEAVATAPRGKNEPIPTQEYIQENAERLFNEMSEINQKHRKTTFVNCWHKNTVESEAMWNLYVKDLTQGIAIQTTYDRLYRAIGREIMPVIGEVNYIDYSKGTVYMQDVHWYKRKSFEHEREVRIIQVQFKEEPERYGISLPVDLDVLIENVYVSPMAQSWFEDIVNDMLVRYGINKKVIPSQLNREVFYG